MTTITFDRLPTTTDRYRERLYRSVVNQPGITLSELGKATGYMDASQRRELLGELIAAGRISVRREPGSNGRVRPSYWPIAA